MRVEVLRSTAVVAALVVLLAGFTGGYATTALFSDREGIDLAVAAAGPVSEQPAARYHVFGADRTWSGDGFGVDHDGDDVVLVTVVDAGDDTLDLVVSRSWTNRRPFAWY